jgi:hypothetical protein
MTFVSRFVPGVAFHVVRFIVKDTRRPWCDTSSACDDETADEQARAEIAKRSTEMACYRGVSMLEH